MVKETEIARHINGVDYESTFENGGERLVVRKVQDVQPIIDLNTRLRNDYTGTQGKTFVKAAVIPNIKIEELMKEGIWQDKKRLKAWLNDPDNRAFRTSTGKI